MLKLVGLCGESGGTDFVFEHNGDLIYYSYVFEKFIVLVSKEHVPEWVAESSIHNIKAFVLRAHAFMQDAGAKFSMLLFSDISTSNYQRKCYWLNIQGKYLETRLSFKAKANKSRNLKYDLNKCISSDLLKIIDSINQRPLARLDNRELKEFYLRTYELLKDEWLT